MKKAKKFLKPGSVASYLQTQHNICRSQPQESVAHIQDHASGESTQINHH